uniref:Uncharacterized protein n=1 Tax=Anguilla anguilla TaxID=7936 RepID=A0A0E9T805_ANGAN
MEKRLNVMEAQTRSSLTGQEKDLRLYS